MKKYKQLTQVVSLQQVLEYYKKDFKSKDGSEIIKIDSYIDTHEGKAIFVISTEEDDGTD